MEKENKKINWTIIIVAIIIGVVLLVFFYRPASNPTNPTIDVKTNTQIGATTVNVGTFYDGQNGYSVSIPSGNSSTCIWTWSDGNADIPDSQTTYAKTATEKHILHISDTARDWKVSCVDDFGNQYTGIFPK
ncbi:MAG: hypothetical protein WCK10_03185 [Candidatus Staskawiczbacteria bacterium]